MNIHFIGINGVSMRALAELTESYGHFVTGSDAATTGHDKTAVEHAELVVYTNAVPDDNCELVRARELGIPAIERAAYLGELSKAYEKVVAVAGCHGKSTATAMLGAACKARVPTVHIGVRDSSSIGERGLFITEACEYRGSFLRLRPSLGIVLNVGYDHPDFYRTKSELTKAYAEFCALSKTSLVNGDDKYAVKLGKNRLTFGLGAHNDFRAKNITANNGKRAFVYKHANTEFAVDLKVPGAHNVYNALAAIAAASMLGIDEHEAAKAIEDFKGLPRRFEYKGSAFGKEVYCDYAHHPAEISATISAAREMFPSVAVVFQPHTYSRTEAMMDEFVAALSDADTVALAPIFAAREKPTGTTSHTLGRKIAENRKSVFCFDTFEEIIEACKMFEEKAIIFMGAGDIDKACDMFVKEAARSRI